MSFSLIFGGIIAAGAVLVSLFGGDTSGLRDTPFGDWALPVWGIGNLLIGSLLIAIGWGIGHRRSWIRPLIIAFWCFIGLGAIVGFVLGVRSGQTWETDLTWVLGLLAAIWYFYLKRNVVSYFGRLSAHREA